MPVRAPHISFWFAWVFFYAQAAMQVLLFFKCCLTQPITKLAESTSVSGITNLQTDSNGSELERVKYRQLQATGNPALIKKMFL